MGGEFSPTSSGEESLIKPFWGIVMGSLVSPREWRGVHVKRHITLFHIQKYEKRSDTHTLLRRPPRHASTCVVFCEPVEPSLQLLLLSLLMLTRILVYSILGEQASAELLASVYLHSRFWLFHQQSMGDIRVATKNVDIVASLTFSTIWYDLFIPRLPVHVFPTHVHVMLTVHSKHDINPHSTIVLCFIWTKLIRKR